MRNLLKFIKALLFMLFYVQGANAALTMDQQQPTMDFSVGGLVIGSTSEQKLAQVVTAGVSGYLTEISLPVSCNLSTKLIIEIQSVDNGGIPDGVVLTSQTISGLNLPSEYPNPITFKSITFSAPVYISEGTQFALVLSQPSTEYSCAIYKGPEGDSYQGGNMFFDSRPNSAGAWIENCAEFPNDHCDLPFQTWVEAILQVSIDIKPDSESNSIYPKSNGVVPVAILTTADFNAADVDQATVRLSVNENETTAERSEWEDVDGDGDIDMILFFRTQSTSISCGTTYASLTGETIDGHSIEGSDSINTIGCQQNTLHTR